MLSGFNVPSLGELTPAEHTVLSNPSGPTKTSAKKSSPSGWEQLLGIPGYEKDWQEIEQEASQLPGSLSPFHVNKGTGKTELQEAVAKPGEATKETLSGAGSSVLEGVKALVSGYGIRLLEVLGGGALILFALVTLARGGNAPNPVGALT